MPTVINGIGTWYYGKRRIHTLKGDCEFCGRHTDLVSYDTTLFFVVVFVPLIPLQRKRILQECSICRRHRVLSLANWEKAKAKDGADLVEKLRSDPDDRDAIMRAVGFAVAYQDEPLFDRVAETFAAERTDDAAIQAQLGSAYAYFARWPRAEEAYRASLAVEDNEAIREQLAFALLKQDRPDDARPYLQHVLDNNKRDSAGMIYLLVAGYQAQGLHEEALALMDERDQAFPELVSLKEYQEQRKTSTRLRATDKKVRSAVLAEGNTGYREGNWTANWPRWVGAAVLLGALALYLGSAIWIGQARKVYLVNGTSKPYSVVVRGASYTVPANSAIPIRVAEGQFPVSFSDARLSVEPVQCQIETSFWSRPFAGHTFVINPDQSAIVLEEDIYYAQNNPRPGEMGKIHFGRAFYSLPGVDYEFQSFPATIQVKAGSEIRKTRVALAPTVAPEVRLRLMQGLEQPEQVKLCQRLLRLDPNDTLFLYWLAGQLSPEEVIAFVETRLDDQPILVEWHRLYQSQMEQAHPETDLRPRYRKLVADTKGQADALYLLGRADPDLEEDEKLCRQAASADPPSGFACYSLGFRALSQARFGEARSWFEKALPLLTEKTLARQMHYDALLANGDYDPLLQVLQTDAQTPGRKLTATMQMIRVHAIRGDKAKAQQTLAEAVQISAADQRNESRKALESMVCCCTKDVDGYLKSLADTPSFAAAFLRGQLKEAAELATLDRQDASTCHGLLYLEASRSGAKELAETQWDALLADLKKGGRDEKLFAEILASGKPPAAPLPQRLAIEPTKKRVLLAVLAQRQPDQAAEMLALAKKLDFQHDALSLCLRKVWKQP